MISRRQKELTDEDIKSLGAIYHSWRSIDWEKDYIDVPGLSKSVPIDDVRKNNYVLTPGRYIDFKEDEETGEAFDEKMRKLTEELQDQMAGSRELDVKIAFNLSSIGYEIKPEKV